MWKITLTVLLAFLLTACGDESSENEPCYEYTYLESPGPCTGECDKDALVAEIRRRQDYGVGAIIDGEEVQNACVWVETESTDPYGCLWKPDIPNESYYCEKISDKSEVEWYLHCFRRPDFEDNDFKCIHGDFVPPPRGGSNFSF